MNGLPHSHDVLRALLAAALALTPLAACSKKSGGISAPSPKSSTRTGTDRDFGGNTSTYTYTDARTDTYTDTGTGTGTQITTGGTTGTTGTTGGKPNGILDTVTGLINGLVGGNKPPTGSTGGNPPGSTGGGNTTIGGTGNTTIGGNTTSGQVTRTQTSISVGTQTRTATSVGTQTRTNTATGTNTTTGNLNGQQVGFPPEAPTNAAGGAPYVKVRALIDRKLQVYVALSHKDGVGNLQYSYSKTKYQIDGSTRDGLWEGSGATIPVTVTFDFQNRRCTAAGRAGFQETQLVPRCE